jgi:hypothetical protein
VCRVEFCASELSTREGADLPRSAAQRQNAEKHSERFNVTGRLKVLKRRKEWFFTTLSRVSCRRQLSKVVLGCVTDWQQGTRGLFRMESFMLTDPASGIRHEVQQLIQLQIDTLRLESSLTSSQLWEYHSRAHKITTLYRELDQIRRDHVKYELRTAS